MCEWMSPVVPTSAWPKIALTVVSGTPLVSMTEAAWCLGLRSPIPGLPIFRAAELQRPQRIPGIGRAADLGSKYEAGRLPARASSELVGSLGSSLLSQHVVRFRAERDRPAALRRLRRQAGRRAGHTAAGSRG